MRFVLSILASLFLVGCATYNPIPDGYTGPISTVRETSSNFIAGTRAHYFSIIKIDDKSVSSSFVETRTKYLGQRTHFSPIMVEHKVLPKNQKFLLLGYVFYPTDAQGLFDKNVNVKGVLEFAPKESALYFVRGKLGGKESSIWIEDVAGNVVKQKFTKNH